MKNLLFFVIFCSLPLHGQNQNINAFIFSAYVASKKELHRVKKIAQINLYPYGFSKLVKKTDYFKIKSDSIPLDQTLDCPNGLPIEVFKKHIDNLSPSLFFLRDTLFVVNVITHRGDSLLLASSDGYPYQSFKYDSKLGKWILIRPENIVKRLYYLKWYGGPDLYTASPFYEGLDKGFYKAVNLIVEKFHSKEDKIYIVSDYLPSDYFYAYGGPRLAVTKFGQSPRKYKRKADWFIGYPSYEFHHDTLVVSISYFRSKDYSKRKLPQLLKQKVSVRLAFNRDSLKWKEVLE